MARSARQLKILELISKKDIETQEDLASELFLAHFHVTQATISRDIKELGLIKIAAEGGKQKYAKESDTRSTQSKITAMFKNAVISIDSAINIVVIKTLSGSASSAGLMIDSLSSQLVLGCVAGDDTVIVVTKSVEAADEIVSTLKGIIGI